MPRVGLGTFKLNDTHQEMITKMIKDGGLRHIDTAPSYKNEAMVGKAIENAYSQKVSRKDMFITSKLDQSRYSDPIKGLEDTLMNLKVDYVDLYLIHWPVNQLKKDEKGFRRNPMHMVWEVMEYLYKKKMAKAIGFCNTNVQMLVDNFAYANELPMVNQIELHPYNQQHNLVEFCQKNKIHVTGYAPLGSPERLEEHTTLNVLKDKTLKKIAKKHGKTPAEISLAWNLQRGRL